MLVHVLESDVKNVQVFACVQYDLTFQTLTESLLEHDLKVLGRAAQDCLVDWPRFCSTLDCEVGV